MIRRDTRHSGRHASRFPGWRCVLPAIALLLATAAQAAAQGATEPKPSLEIYGFAMLDIGHDFKQINPNWFDTMRVTKLPSVEDEFGRDQRAFAGVRQSR